MASRGSFCSNRMRAIRCLPERGSRRTRSPCIRSVDRRRRVRAIRLVKGLEERSTKTAEQNHRAIEQSEYMTPSMKRYMREILKGSFDTRSK